MGLDDETVFLPNIRLELVGGSILAQRSNGVMYFTDGQTTVVNGIVCNEQQNTRDNKRCKTVNGLAFFINLWGVIIGYNQCSKFIPFPAQNLHAAQR